MSKKPPKDGKQQSESQPAANKPSTSRGETPRHPEKSHSHSKESKSKDQNAHKRKPAETDKYFTPDSSRDSVKGPRSDTRGHLSIQKSEGAKKGPPQRTASAVNAKEVFFSASSGSDFKSIGSDTSRRVSETRTGPKTDTVTVTVTDTAGLPVKVESKKIIPAESAGSVLNTTEMDESLISVAYLSKEVQSGRTSKGIHADDEDDRPQSTANQRARLRNPIRVPKIDEKDDSTDRNRAKVPKVKTQHVEVKKGAASESVSDPQRPKAAAKLADTKEGKPTRVVVNDDDTSDLEEYKFPKTQSKKLASIESKMHTNLMLGSAFIYLVVPPDGGFGWVIMVVSFLCQVIVDGIIFGIGIMLPDMAKDLHVSGQNISMVASIQIGFYFLAGSFSSAFINRYGFRPVAMVGAIASICAIFISTFSPNLQILIILYSVIAGPMLSMIWVSSQLIIGYYFEKYRPIANGLSCSGAGAGILIFSGMNSQLVPLIGWRNTSRIHAAILSTVLLMSLTYIEVKPTRVGSVIEPDIETDSGSEENGDELLSYRFSRGFSIRPSTHSVIDHRFSEMLETYDKVEGSEPGFCVRLWSKCCPWLRRRDETAVEDAGGRISRGYIIRHDPMEKQDLFYPGPIEYDIHKDANETSEVLDGKQVELDPRLRSVKSVTHALSMMQPARPSVTRRMTYKELKASKAPRPLISFISPANWVPAKIKVALHKLFDFRLLRIMEFQVLLASAFLFPMGFNIPFVYSKVRADVGPFHEAMISPVIGLSNFIFRIASGFIAQKFKTWTTYICGGGIAFGGATVFVSAFYGADKVWFQYTYAFCYGVAPAFYSTLRAIIYVRSLGLDRLTNAFGLTAMAMGFGVFAGTTTAGILNEYTGNYSASFAFAGLCLMSAGGLKLILPTLITWKDNKAMKGRKVQFT